MLGHSSSVAHESHLRQLSVNCALASSRVRAIAMEAIYAFFHFASTVFVYQLVVHWSGPNAWEFWTIIYKTVFAALIFFFGASSFNTLCYHRFIRRCSSDGSIARHVRTKSSQQGWEGASGGGKSELSEKMQGRCLCA